MHNRAARPARHKTLDERVKAIVVQHLGADELDIVELTMAFEEEFKVEIADADAEKFTRVGDAIRYLRGKVK